MTESKPQLPNWEKLLPAMVVLVMISLVSVLAMDWLGGAAKIRELVQGAGSWGPLVFVLLKASTYVIAPLSGTPMRITAGALFGVWDGLLYTSLGDILGGTLNFWIARVLGRRGIRRFAGAKAIRQVDETAEHVGGWKALLVARLLLSGLYDFISYAAGLSNLPFKHYVWVTIVGGIPQALLWVYVGNALVTGPNATYILVAMTAVLVAAWAVQRRQARKKD